LIEAAEAKMRVGLVTSVAEMGATHGAAAWVLCSAEETGAGCVGNWTSILAARKQHQTGYAGMLDGVAAGWEPT
jgi:hypothetical protein